MSRVPVLVVSCSPLAAQRAGGNRSHPPIYVEAEAQAVPPKIRSNVHPQTGRHVPLQFDSLLPPTPENLREKLHGSHLPTYPLVCIGAPVLFRAPKTISNPALEVSEEGKTRIEVLSEDGLPLQCTNRITARTDKEVLQDRQKKSNKVPLLLMETEDAREAPVHPDELAGIFLNKRVNVVLLTICRGKPFAEALVKRGDVQAVVTAQGLLYDCEAQILTAKICLGLGRGYTLQQCVKEVREELKRYYRQTNLSFLHGYSEGERAGVGTARAANILLRGNGGIKLPLPE